MIARLLALLSVAAGVHAAVEPATAAPIPGTVNPAPAGFHYIDTSIENASPLWYEPASDGSIQIHLLYDLERDSPNRAAGHIHFRIDADPGAKLTLEFRNLDNVWNGKPGSIARELKTVVTSTDGVHWKSQPTTTLPGDRIRLSVEMPGPRLYVARVEPYRITDLNRLLDSIRNQPLVAIREIGRTVQNRSLEIVRIGHPDAPHRVFLRARAHPWEAGSNWVVEGFIRRLLSGDEASREFLESYCAYIMPMANKDGVANGRTRFNFHGKDLNRDWGRPADPDLVPENAALESWLQSMIASGQRPQLALELHNDGNGRLHISRAPGPQLDRYLQRMKILEALLRRDTWFTEGHTESSFQNSGTLGEGWLARFGIDAAVHEFNCNWIAGLNDYPSATHWKEYGAGLAQAFHDYFRQIGEDPRPEVSAPESRKP